MDATYYGGGVGWGSILYKRIKLSIPGMTETMCEWKTQNPKACSAA